MSFVTDVGDSIGSIFSSFGNDKVGEDINNILAIAGGAGQVGIGKLASGDIIGGVKDLAKGISEVVGGIVRMNDATKEREIERLQKTNRCFRRIISDVGQCNRESVLERCV